MENQTHGRQEQTHTTLIQRQFRWVRLRGLSCGWMIDGVFVFTVLVVTLPPYTACVRLVTCFACQYVSSCMSALACTCSVCMAVWTGLALTRTAIDHERLFFCYCI